MPPCSLLVESLGLVGGEPLLMAQKPLTPSAFLAELVAAIPTFSLCMSLYGSSKTSRSCAKVVASAALVQKALQPGKRLGDCGLSVLRILIVTVFFGF